MDIYDVIPLYKILCITIMLLIPLLPALLLYKHAPKDTITAEGVFSGFKINATGATAIFIVLFAAIYVNMNGILKDIIRIPDYHSRIDQLTDSIATLQNKIPWKVSCVVDIEPTANMTVAEIIKQYNSCLQENMIQTMPMPMNVFHQEKRISFYVDDDVLKSCSNSYSITLPNGFGTNHIKFCPTKADSLTKTIVVSDIVHKNSNNPSQSGNHSSMLQTYTIAQSISSIDSLPKPAPASNIKQ